MTVKVHLALAKALRDIGVDTMFGLIGDANLYMVDAFVRECGGRFVGAANEAGAVQMALGHAQVTGRTAVATVTHGPGLTNALTSMVEGVKASVPVLLLVGDTPVDDRDHLQKAAQREFITATGAGFEQLRAPETLSVDIATAWRRAATERRPVALNMPIEFQWREVDYSRPDAFVSQDRTFEGSGPEMDKAIGIIAAAKRPIVLAGRGAAMHGAEAAIVRLAERIGAPLATTLLGKGLFAGNPFNIGIFGTLSHELASEVIGQSDCVIAFGASLNRFTTDARRLLNGKRVIHVNAERSHLGRFATPDAALAGDLEATADAMVKWLDEAEIPPSGTTTEELRLRLAAFRRPAKADRKSRPGTVDMRRVLHRLDETMPADRIFVTDAGRFVLESWATVDVALPRSFVFTVAYGSIGLGLGEAIGASVAAPGRPTLLVAGDGGFMLGCLTELRTAVRECCDMVIVVLNDGSYGAEHIQFRRKDMDPTLSLLDTPDLEPVATALGAAGLTVRDDDDLERAIQAIASRDRSRPLLVDVKLDPDCIPFPH
ncbi:MAG: thiamine pyrophosphate-binding protein [Rhizobiaceae bacterium]|nr:thiamine pyrophosphate-binding protein [Rhizobiaceae bacterium]